MLWVRKSKTSISFFLVTKHNLAIPQNKNILESHGVSEKWSCAALWKCAAF
jgi:hypothetical protein